MIQGVARVKVQCKAGIMTQGVARVNSMSHSTSYIKGWMLGTRKTREEGTAAEQRRSELKEEILKNSKKRRRAQRLEDHRMQSIMINQDK